MTDMRNESNFEKVLDKAVAVISQKVFEESQRNIVSMGVTDTGFLLRSGLIRRGPGGHVISYSAPYAWQVEKGRLPGSMPPVEALEKWVERKLRVPRKDVRKAAWGVAMKIKHYGTQPHPFVEEAILKVSRSRYRVVIDQ